MREPIRTWAEEKKDYDALLRVARAAKEMIGIRKKCGRSPIRFAPVTTQIVDALKEVEHLL